MLHSKWLSCNEAVKPTSHRLRAAQSLFTPISRCAPILCQEFNIFGQNDAIFGTPGPNELLSTPYE